MYLLVRCPANDLVMEGKRKPRVQRTLENGVAVNCYDVGAPKLCAANNDYNEVPVEQEDEGSEAVGTSADVNSCSTQLETGSSTETPVRRDGTPLESETGYCFSKSL